MLIPPEKGAIMTANKSLILILGDQLSLSISSLSAADRTKDVVLIAEVKEETTYVPHHKKKITFVLSAMRHFASELADAGWQVDYVKLDDAQNSGSLVGEIEHALEHRDVDRVLITEPGEWRLEAQFRDLQSRLDVPMRILVDDRFLCSRAEFADWAAGRKQLRMEYFYRKMRRDTGLLMDGDKPEGGRWNFDSENRKPAGLGLNFPEPLRNEPDAITRDVLSLVSGAFGDNFGALEPFWFGVTRQHAEAALEHFVDGGLQLFGDYQDAMLTGEKFLFHSVLSLYLNVGLLDPFTVCKRVEAEYRKGSVPLNSAEGFIRQIIGWREFVRGIYWLKMPSYGEENYFGNTRPLPSFYWTGNTDMACLNSCISQTRDEAYAHHIQRLMVTGNFAMLAGVDPKALHEWYLAVYADAYEWVEIPNTLGMSQFADGGLLGSKPYAASGNYINRMSDYCASCRYDVKQKQGSDACPFNYLYWDFLARNREKLGQNPRLGPVYRTWDGMNEERKKQVRGDSAKFLKTML
jgi:deoxyribodipyrimidine photolyase-related protein